MNSTDRFNEIFPRMVSKPTGRFSRIRRIGIAMCVAAAVPTAVHAGQSCEQVPARVSDIAQAMELAQRTRDAFEREYAQSQTQVMMLARAGQDLRKYGLRYSHLGFAYRTPEGEWRVVHKLNTCNTSAASLYRQGLGEFFMDKPWRYEAAWQPLSPTVSEKVLALLMDRTRITAMHIRPYSVVSYTWGLQYQQSNQWVIETMAAAIEPMVLSRGQAQAWLKFNHYYSPPLEISPLTRLGGQLTMANVAFDDHPSWKRFANQIETVTAESVFGWLNRRGYATTGLRTVY